MTTDIGLMQNMPKSSKRSNTFVQLQHEVEHLEKTLVEHIRSKTQNMTSQTAPIAHDINTRLRQTPVAIVGMASIFPQSRNLEEYWHKIITKADCITDVPASRWNVDDYYDPNPRAPDKTYCKRGGFIPEIDFNPMEFGIPPNQLEVTDISQLLALAVAKEALKDAGYQGDKPFDNEHTGVVLGVALARQLTMPLAARLQYPVWAKALKSSGISDSDTEKIIQKIKNSYVDWEPNAFPGMLANVVAGRIANRFDLGGMNCIVDAACASSFGALSMAIAELTSGRANMMLTGGVDTDNSIVAYMCFSKTPAVSRSQTTKPFDVDSDGMMLGEGVGMLVLKRLEDAERDQDRIYAVIKGVGASSDGRHKSIYAPRPEGQMKALRRAYEEAGFTPDTVAMIEAHGTGTMAGDPAEFSALKAVFKENIETTQEIALGSVKSQIGHTKAAAGAASLIKTALALHHKVLPPTINVTQPHPKLEIEKSPFYLNTQTRPWLKSAKGTPRRAGVSSFGFGGTNYHIVLEEYESEHNQQYRLNPTPQEILIAAATPQELIAQAQEVLQKLQSTEAQTYFIELGEASKTLEIAPDAARLGFVAANIPEAVNKLKKGLNFLEKQPELTHWNHPLGIFYRQASFATKGKVVALFSGQGSQYLEMGRELVMNFPYLRETYNQVDRLFELDDLKPVSQVVFPPPVFDEAQQKQQAQAVHRTEIAQSAIAAFSTGLYKILQQAGFKPDFVAGHSFGELTALWAAGVFSDQDYFFLVKERGQAMAQSADTEDAGAMLAVKGDISKIRDTIESFDKVVVANCNSPQQIVLAGEKAAILDAQAILEEQGYSAVVLPVSAAFHTPLVAHAQAPFAAAVEAVTFNQPRIPVFTNTSGNLYPPEPAECQKILKQHLLSRVLFEEEIENIYAAGGNCFIEFGPRSILTYLVQEILGDRPHLAVALNPSRQKDSDFQLREAVIQLKVAGLSLADFDPYQIAPTKPRKLHPLSVKLSSVNYVSDKTRQALEEALQETDSITSESKVSESKVKQASSSTAMVSQSDRKNQSSNGHYPTSATAQANGHSDYEPTFNLQLEHQPNLSNQTKQLATTQKVSMNSSSTDNSPKPSHAAEIPLERILGSLEYSLSQFHLSQQETLEVHKQYLQYQSQYTQTFFQLMQQQNQLWTNVQTASGDSQVKSTVLETAERSLMKFQEHQGNTLRVHEQYLNHQAKYVHNFFLLTQASYSQLLSGDLKLSFSQDAIVSENEPEANILMNEPIRAKQITTIPDNGNGHHPEAKFLVVETANGNGISSYDDGSVAIKETLNGTNGYHAQDSSAVVTQVDTAATIESEPPAVTPSIPEIDFATLSQTLLNVVSEKTGYPPEMLELDMDLEADLGIDSIKRVEILGGLQEQMPNLPQPDLEDLTELSTLNQIIEYLRSFEGKSAASEATPAVESSATEQAVLASVSEVTGYPISNLSLEMNLETDLGIDSVKKRALFDALQQKLSAVAIDWQDPALTELETIAQVLNYLEQKPQKKTLKTPAMSSLSH